MLGMAFVTVIGSRVQGRGVRSGLLRKNAAHST
jgi:hypothetical protein